MKSDTELREELTKRYIDKTIAEQMIVPIVIKLTVVIIAIIYGISNSNKTTMDFVIAAGGMLVLYFMVSMIVWIFRFLSRFFWGIIFKSIVSCFLTGLIFAAYQIWQSKVIGSLPPGVAEIVDIISILLLGIPLVIDIILLISFIRMKLAK